MTDILAVGGIAVTFVVTFVGTLGFLMRRHIKRMSNEYFRGGE